jgi:hypothetical protein
LTREHRRSRPPTDSVASPQPEPTEAGAEERSWLKADYVGHVFHYRMPETVAIASVNPVVPSPLTIKLALVASLLRDGRIGDAELLAPRLPDLEVRISPPDASIIFRALLRYVRPPAEGGPQRIDANTGGAYGTNPTIGSSLSGEVGQKLKESRRHQESSLYSCARPSLSFR